MLNLPSVQKLSMLSLLHFSKFLFPKSSRCKAAIISTQLELCSFISCSSNNHFSEPLRTQDDFSPSRAMHLDCILNEEEGFYQIGPRDRDNRIFVLSVTISLASNLAKVCKITVRYPT